MPVVPRYDDDLRLAHVLADAAERTAMAWFGNPELAASVKEDHTLVTQADRETEEVIRHQLARTRPRDGIRGEELGESGSGSRQWVIDPIDGTNNFVHGVPVWGTLIALLEDGDPVVSVVSAPALARRWWASPGAGARTGRSLASSRVIRVSTCESLDRATLGYTSVKAWTRPGQRSAFLELVDDVWRTRGLGDFWPHMLVAEGAIDVAVEPQLAVHDMAALVPIVTEAGGMFTAIDGTPGCWGGSAVSSNGLLHDVVAGRLHV